MQAIEFHEENRRHYGGTSRKTYCKCVLSLYVQVLLQDGQRFESRIYRLQWSPNRNSNPQCDLQAVFVGRIVSLEKRRNAVNIKIDDTTGTVEVSMVKSPSEDMPPMLKDIVLE